MLLPGGSHTLPGTCYFPVDHTPCLEHVTSLWITHPAWNMLLPCGSHTLPGTCHFPVDHTPCLGHVTPQCITHPAWNMLLPSELHTLPEICYFPVDHTPCLEHVPFEMMGCNSRPCSWEHWPHSVITRQPILLYFFESIGTLKYPNFIQKIIKSLILVFFLKWRDFDPIRREWWKNSNDSANSKLW